MSGCCLSPDCCPHLEQGEVGKEPTGRKEPCSRAPGAALAPRGLGYSFSLGRWKEFEVGHSNVTYANIAEPHT